MHIWRNGKKHEYPEGTVALGTVAGEYFNDQNTTTVSHFAFTEAERPDDPGQLFAYGIKGPNTPNTCLLYTSPSPRDS